MSLQYRQGDVFLMQVELLPSGAEVEEISDEKIVLAYGEVTGHSHSVSPEDAKLYRSGDDRYLVVETNAKLIHEEHDAITLPNGVYRVIRQREYSPRNSSELVRD
jgi:hypothetical protein